MKNQNNQEDECFLQSQTEQLKETQATEEENIPHDEIRKSLPQANQLKPDHRPTTMIPRIMKIQPQSYLLPQIINLSCKETVCETKNSGMKPNLDNRQKYNLQDYLNKKQFHLLYNKQPKVNPITTDTNDLTIRLRPIAQVSDYNHKLFKQLSQQKTINPSKDTIDSNFECGNLGRAYGHHHNENAYYLLLEQDTNTHGYTNWFFFRFRNTGVGFRKFYILNISKTTSFYKQGMKISIFSMKKHEKTQTKWLKGGDEIYFFNTNFIRNYQSNECFKCLYFEYNFEYENDEVYFATTQPYTYSRMATLLNQINTPTQLEIHEKVKYRIETIGYSVSNNIIPAITIYKQENQNIKQTIVFMGRQHPSEVSGSFLSENLIKIFLQNNESSDFLLEKFNIVIIPMTNPDGVIYGNSRSNLAGYDLNRHWGADPIKQMTPETYRIRSFLCSLHKSTGIAFHLDLHGHGKMLNSFLFCCRNEDKISSRCFPMIMSKLEERFHLLSCTYDITKDKQNTIRAQLHAMGVKNCYTLENSYHGYRSTTEILPYNEDDYFQIAISIVKSLYLLFSTSPEEKSKAEQKLGWNIESIREQLNKRVEKLEKEQNITQNKSEILSESDPEGDDLNLEERLKICKNKNLTKKIRQPHKKHKNNHKKSRREISKNILKNGRQCLQMEGNQIEKDDVKKEKNKNEGKIVLSKKFKTQQKIRTAIKDKKAEMKRKQSNNSQQSKSKISYDHNLLSSKVQANFGIKRKNNSFLARNQTQTGRRYEKMKTQPICYSENEIKEQNERKQKIQEEYSKLKNQSLRNVINQLFLTPGSSFRHKKCRWLQEKSVKFRTSSHLIESRMHSYTIKRQNSSLFDNLNSPNTSMQAEQKSRQSISYSAPFKFKLNLKEESQKQTIKELKNSIKVNTFSKGKQIALNFQYFNSFQAHKFNK